MAYTANETNTDKKVTGMMFIDEWNDLFFYRQRAQMYEYRV